MILPIVRASASAAHNMVVSTQVRDRLARVEKWAADYDLARVALDKLKTSPNDPDANLAAGRYDCFDCGDFTLGLPMLAKSSDTALKALAAADLALPTSVSARTAAGDQWWDQAAREVKSPIAADRCKARAGHWYRLAEPKLTGLLKVVVDQKLAGLPDDRSDGLPFTNDTDAREGRDVLDEVASRYPEALKGVTNAELVKYHDGTELHRTNAAAPKAMPGTYAANAVSGSRGGIMLCCVYEKWEPGTYLFVYRVQASSPPAGNNVCFLDVCNNGNTVSSHQPKSTEFEPDHWVAMPLSVLKLDETKKLEYRLWPNDHSIALDCVYIFRIERPTP